MPQSSSAVNPNPSRICMEGVQPLEEGASRSRHPRSHLNYNMEKIWWEKKSPCVFETLYFAAPSYCSEAFVFEPEGSFSTLLTRSLGTPCSF